MPLPFIGLLFILTIGFAKLSATTVNHLLAEKKPRWFGDILKLVHLSSIGLYALLLFDHFRSIGSDRIFDPQATGAFVWIARALVALGGIGVLLLIRSMVEYQSYQPPACQLNADSSLIDFRQSESAESWKRELVGPGPMRWAALLPGNEQFTIEVSTKTFSLPRLPKEWDGLSIVPLADTHFRGAVTRRYFEQVCDQAIALKPDIFVFTGDLLDDPSLVEWLPTTFGRLKAPLGQYFVLGNHDWYTDITAVRTGFLRLGWIDLSERTFELDSLTAGPAILLAGDESPWMGAHPTVDSASEKLFRILLSHTPDNIQWARDHGFDLVMAGHTHGGQIRLPLLGPVQSPSRYGCKYASGLFWLEPTLLYVSRGISGKEPIRYLCPPELTKLVLRCPSSAVGAIR